VQLLWALLVCYLPSPLARRVARLALGWEIHPTAYLGRSQIRVGHVSMGPGTSIGPRNNIRGLAELRMAEGSNIATRNSITAFPKAAELSQDVFPHSPNREPVLVLGVGAKVTDNHEIDCSDRVELGRHAALAGFASQVLTHSLNLVTDRQTTNAVLLGDHCAVMSGCIIQSGCSIPARAIISAGSVVTTRLTQEQAFYRGNPAELVRELPDHLAYFHRGEEPAADAG
jgi:acetyltransferase-like isoleucine patch superfamily enzyme